MRKKILLPIFTLAFFACLFFAAVIPARTNASAEETNTPSCEIVAESLQLKDNVYILYAVDFKNTQSTDSTGLLVWDAPQTNYTHTNANTVLTTSKTETIDGVDYAAFTYTKLSAKQMTDVVYASAYIERDGTYYYGNVIKYSILEYAYNKLGLTEAVPTEENSLKSLLNAMLAYGSAAQTHFDYKTDNLASSEDFTYVRISNAKFEDGFNYGLFKAGSTVTVTPDEGYGLSASGSTIFTENTNGTLTLTVPTDKMIDKTSIAKKSTVAEGLTYALSSDGLSYSVTGIGTCEDTAIIIPSTYDGKPVKSISSDAFQNNATLTSVTIPENVTNIGDNAFKNCSNLMSVTIPESVTKIGWDAFENCSNLTSVDISDVDAWCGVSFSGREANPLYYAKNLYLNGKLLENLVISEGVTEIKTYAFNYTTGIKTVTIPKSVKKIGSSFDYCTGLKGVYITDIKAWIDIEMDSLNSLLQEAENLYLNNVLVEDLVLSAEDGYTKVKNFYGARCLKSVTLPEGITEICKHAFRWCSNLKTINIPTTVKTIGEGLFEGCTSLGYTAYDNAKYLGSTQNPYLMLVKATAASITSCTIHPDTKIIATEAFYGCEFTAITIPNGVTEIQKSAFRCCQKLESITIPDSVTKLDAYVFDHCDVLATVTIGTGVTEIGVYAFWRCPKLTSIVIPNGVTEISGWLFRECTALTEITIGVNVNRIANNVFDGCTALTTINFSGTMEQWKKISKDSTWKTNAGAIVEEKPTTDFTVVCTDGNISKANA